ncbi:hypothetical protein AK812_SmicGene10780 [Symbiodinium microadriaticum]|uniref:Uncharacterized protein n=1 Tax=Symbiodinium microadriaticum TaxID=2951 RepID=A0A1Q9EEW6_SYMMI|nr:hypothetical protein AK812_SmicGene10780 [Symbiodinium microadriaticum]CAE7889714.1 unnamed protein product [Symbiodinium microadriaticum]CAE7946770.1 unnamed protein product [Symbiodinium sp. KB8]
MVEEAASNPQGSSAGSLEAEYQGCGNPRGRAAPPETHEIDDDEEEELEEGEEVDVGLDFGPTEATEMWRALLEFDAASGTASSSSTSQAFLPHYIVDNIQQAVESMTDEEINIFLNEWVRIQARMGEQVHLAIRMELLERAQRRREHDEAGLLQHEGKPKVHSPNRKDEDDEEETTCLMQSTQVHPTDRERTPPPTTRSMAHCVPSPMQLQQELDSNPTEVRSQRARALLRALDGTRARLVSDKDGIVALLVTYAGDNADTSGVESEHQEWVARWMRRLTGKGPATDPTEESIEEVVDSYEQAMQEEQAQVEEYNAREEASEKERDQQAAEAYQREQDAREAQQKDDRTMQVALGMSYRRPKKTTRVRVHMTVGANERRLEMDVSEGEGVVITMQAVTIREPEQWFENGVPIPWWTVPAELRQEQSGGATGSDMPPPTWCQSRSLRNATVLNLADPLVYGYYKLWQEGRLSSTQIREQGGLALLSFLEACHDGDGQLEETTQVPTEVGQMADGTLVESTTTQTPEPAAPVDTTFDETGGHLSVNLDDVHTLFDPDTVELPGFDDVQTSD